MLARLHNRLRQYRDSGPVIRPLIARYCIGKGLEIGPGKSPQCPPDRTEYLDKHTENADGTPNANIIAEADSIPRPDASYDFVFSSHVLEHLPNVIKALHEWLRVLKPGGNLFLVLPHADRTFDRMRAKTTLEHLIEDHQKGVTAPDRSHIEEMERGWKAQGRPEDDEEYRRRWGADPWDWDFRFANDVVHYHVWTQDEIVRLLQHLGLKILYANELVTEREDSFVVVARKPAE